jgi:hypothetical protein
MQQRVSIARALGFEPRLLMMDEPFGALDEITRDSLNVQLQDLWRREQRTVVFVTHSIAEAVYLSTRIVVMSPRPGRIVKIIDSPLPAERTLALRDTRNSPRWPTRCAKPWPTDTMSTDALRRRVLPVMVVGAVILVLWYAAAIGLNAPGTIERVLAPRAPGPGRTCCGPPWPCSARCCPRRTRSRPTSGPAWSTGPSIRRAACGCTPA